jgi:hypothetical protein
MGGNFMLLRRNLKGWHFLLNLDVYLSYIRDSLGYTIDDPIDVWYGILGFKNRNYNC